ncbi:uncharacterized protein C2orf81 homolog [Pelodytes ibericus]
MSKTTSITKAGRDGAGQATSRTATSKSRVEKSRVVTVAPDSHVTVEFVPGRLTEEDWLSLVGMEDGEDSMDDFMDSLLARVMDNCYKVYLARQVVPYTVSQARDALIQMVEWTFVPRDEGQEQLDLTWQEEEQPQPCLNDSWAQGCVPVTHPTSPSIPAQVVPDTPLNEIPEEEEAELSSPANPGSSTPLSLDQDVREETDPTSTETSTTPQVLMQPIPPPPQPQKTKRPYRPHLGPLRSAGLKNITKSLAETEKEMFLKQLINTKKADQADTNINLMPTALYNLIKIQRGRPAQKKDVVYDESGNILSVPKLDPSKLSEHHVRPQVEILHSTEEVDSKGKKIFNGQPTSKHLKHGRRPRQKDDLSQTRSFQHVCSSSESLGGRPFQPCPSINISESTMAPIALSAGILLDTMQLSHGVILRKGSSTERGTFHSLSLKEQGRREGERDAKPIHASVALPRISVDQLIKNHVPEVRPLASFMSF